MNTSARRAMLLRRIQASPKRSEDILRASTLYTNSSPALSIPILHSNNRLWAWWFCDEPSPVEHRTPRCQCRRFVPFQFAELPPSRRCNPLHPPRRLAPFLPIQVTLILGGGGGFVAIAARVSLIPGPYNARRREFLPPIQRRRRRQAVAWSPNTTEDHSMRLLLHCGISCGAFRLSTGRRYR